jgi:hypothetical protein
MSWKSGLSFIVAPLMASHKRFASWDLSFCAAAFVSFPFLSW